MLNAPVSNLPVAGIPLQWSRLHGVAFTANTRLVVLTLLASVALPLASSAADSTWGGSSDNFSNPAAWDVAPSTTDDAIVASGTVAVTTNETVNSLSVQGGPFIFGTVNVSGAGTLNLADGATLTGGVFNVNGIINGDVTANGGTFNNNGTLNGDFTQTSFTQTNLGTINGTVTLSGGTLNNTTGTVGQLTTITGGTLESGGTLDDVDNQAGGTLKITGGTAGAVTNAGSGTNAGTIDSFTQTAGTFANSGTVTNATTLSGGTLSNSGSLDTVNVQAGATFNNQSGGSTAAITNAGTMTNAGTVASLTQTAGTFLNTSIISGAVSIAGGTLTNNGTASGSVNVTGGGLVKGTGSFGTLVIGSGGIIAPGNSIGTTTVTGNLTFNAGSTYQVELDNTGASDLIDVTGNVTINGGTVAVTGAAGSYSLATVYTIIDAVGPITGTFSTLTTNLAFLSPGLIYNTNSVQLGFGRNSTTFGSVGQTINQRSVGAALDAGKVPDAIKDIILSADANMARRSYDDISGDIYPSLGGLMLDDSHALRSTLFSRLAEPTPEQAAWFQAYGSWTHHFSAGTSAPITASSGGMLAGADGEIAEGWRLGAAGGYGYTFASTGSTRAEADVDTYSAAVYLGGELGPVSFRSGASYSFHDADVERTIAFGGLNLAPRGSFQAETRQVFSELAYGIDLGTMKVEPFVNLAFVDYRSDALQETGGTGALTISGIYDHAIYSLIGTRFATQTVIEDIPVEIGGMVGWRHAHDAGSPAAKVNFAGEAGFDVLGATVVEDTFLAELTARFKIAPATTLDASWQGSFAGQALNQKVSVKLGLAF